MGSPDPNGLTIVFRCDQIDNLSDSQYCNPAYDALYDEQSKEAGDQRHATMAKMQNLIYDEAPYDVLYYDSDLDVYRNDRFAGWQNMPADGTPFFSAGDSVLDYTLLTDATAQPSADPRGRGAVGIGRRRRRRPPRRRPRRARVPARAPPRAAAGRTRPSSWSSW